MCLNFERKGMESHLFWNQRQEFIHRAKHLYVTVTWHENAVSSVFSSSIEWVEHPLGIEKITLVFHVPGHQLLSMTRKGDEHSFDPHLTESRVRCSTCLLTLFRMRHERRHYMMYTRDTQQHALCISLRNDEKRKCISFSGKKSHRIDFLCLLPLRTTKAIQFVSPELLDEEVVLVLWQDISLEDIWARQANGKEC